MSLKIPVCLRCLETGKCRIQLAKLIRSFVDKNVAFRYLLPRGGPIVTQAATLQNLRFIFQNSRHFAELDGGVFQAAFGLKYAAFVWFFGLYQSNFTATQNKFSAT